MSVMSKEYTSTEIAAINRERYMLIHKRPVGPKTAERLFSLYEGLSISQRPREMYSAGWAIAEAAIVGTQLDDTTRATYVQAAEDCWNYSLDLERTQAAERAWSSSLFPMRREEFRIMATLAALPVLQELPFRKPSRESVTTMHSSLVDVALCNSEELKTTKEYYGKEGRASNYRGFAYEQIALLGMSRIRSTRMIPLVSFARSDEGSNYPSQTHDIQVFTFRGRELDSVSPFEVKTKRSTGFFSRYTDVGLITGTSLVGEGDEAIHNAISLFDRERNGVISGDEQDELQEITDKVIHDMRHFRRPERYGKHCLGLVKCTLMPAA